MAHFAGEHRSGLRIISRAGSWTRAGTGPETETVCPASSDGDVTRNIVGQSLDDARAQFHADWQVRLARRRRAVDRARRLVSLLHRITEWLLAAGALFGAISGVLLGLLSGQLPMLLDAMVLGALIGAGATLPLLLLVQLPAWALRWYAFRTEAAINSGQPL